MLTVAEAGLGLRLRRFAESSLLFVPSPKGLDPLEV